jgi:hypothetical protein
MVQSHTLAANSRSASQEMPRLVWNPKVHYRVHKKQPLDPFMSQINSVYTLTVYFSSAHTSIIPASVPSPPRQFSN